MENRRVVNWEKIGVYVACLGFIFIFWQGQMTMQEKISDIRERLARLEVVFSLKKD